LVLYNLLGQEIAALKRDKKVAGYYKVKQIVSNLPTGVYFYRLTAGKFMATKNLSLIR
jgi:hypothetical protein